MKLLHCGDLHLDSALETHFSAQQAAQRRRELLLSFGRIVDYAVNEKVRAVLIAGDLFDAEPVRRETSAYVLGLIAANPQVDFLYLHGNHDPRALRGEELPPNLHLFSDEWQTFVYEDVAVSGVERTSENADACYETLPEVRGGDTPAKIHIVLLHGQLTDGQNGPEQLDRGRLKNRGITYLALGHLHSYVQRPLDAGGVTCYCGCPEGRGFDECGEKGVVLLNTENGVLQTAFVPIARRRLWKIPVNISGMKTAREIEAAIAAETEKLSPEDMVRVQLTGSYSERAQRLPALWQLRFAERFAYFELEDRSRLLLNPEDYAADATLKGEFVRLVSAAEMTEEQRSRVLLLGIRALEGELPE